jgi:cobaltochelatase CobN
MHILATATTTLEEIAEPVDLCQPPGDIAVLSFADSDLAGLAAAWLVERDFLPSVRFAHLRDLRHPMSVDLWIERVGSRAKVILVRLLGGADWWRYGVEQLAATARTNRIALALLPGEDRDDPRLAQASTLPEGELDALLNYFREGGRENLRALLRRLARHAGGYIDVPAPQPLPRVTAYLPGEGAVSLDRLMASCSLAHKHPPLEGAGWGGGAAAFAAPPSPPPGPLARADLPPPGGGVRSSVPISDLPAHEGEAQGNVAAPRPVVPIIFYRALLLAADTAAIDALCAALTARGLAPAPLAVTSLKEGEAKAFIRDALARLRPAVIVTTTAFAAGGEPGEPTPLDGPDVPVLQAVIAATKRAAWHDNPRGLGAADLAMHVVLPELDGRVLAGALAFKDTLLPEGDLAFTALANRPERDRIDAVADRVAALVRLRAKPRGERRVAVLMPDYPGAPGRAGYAVGLDVPASVVALLEDLAEAGYRVSHAAQTSRTLLDALAESCATARLPLDAYVRLLADLPCDPVKKIHGAWGDAACDPDVHAGSFRFRAVRCGNAIIALPPDRGRAESRRADYHDPALPPRHALVAFALWLRHVEKIDALVHMGAHGTLEWLPGKAIALTSACFPDALIGPLPVFYPFIVSNPGEAAQAKRRIAAVTIGHLPPPLVAAPLSGAACDLERLVEEYMQADGLDRRRRERLARLIVETARTSGLAGEAGVEGDADPDTALRRIDAWLCDLKDLAIKDGLHVYGRAQGAASSPSPCLRGEGRGEGPLPQAQTRGDAPSPALSPHAGRGEGLASAQAEREREASAAAERVALLAALDGRRVAPGPAGAPDRGRRDVLPTGRNLFTADPRMLPTPTALDLGRLAADEVIRSHLQAHGEMPRALVIDLWGSATLRTGGEEIAQGLALMGCRPVWDQSGRVTGIEVLPPALVGRPRVDVTWRISGLFRDLFPAQIALIDAAVRAIAARDEGDDNPLATACRAGNDWAAVAGPAAVAVPATAAAPARIFGTAPGAYGAGIEPMLGRETDRDAIATAYLAATSHAYGGAEGGAVHLPGAFTARVASADLLLHPSDDPARDLLEGAEDAAFVGGFAAAAASLGRAPDLIMLDTTDPQRPRARPLGAALARIVRARAINPRFIAGQMRHGPRGAAELAETVDRLIAFAQTTGEVASALIDLVHDAYLADAGVRDFLLRENPAAARAIAERLDGARRNGWWHPRRNDIDAELRIVMAEARA